MRIPKRRFVILAAIALAIAAAFLAVLLRPSGDASEARIRDLRLTLVPISRRSVLPKLAGSALDPPPPMIRLGALVGKPAFIDVWASWCLPCRAEAPMLARLWRRYGGRVQFVGIDVEDNRGDARAFIRRYGVGYPNIFDTKASLAGKLGFFGLPTAYLVDERGRIAAKLVGKQKEATLASGLAALVGEAKGRRNVVLPTYSTTRPS